MESARVQRNSALMSKAREGDAPAGIVNLSQPCAAATDATSKRFHVEQWLRLSLEHSLLRIEPGLYRQFMERPPTETDAVLRRDLGRTFPGAWLIFVRCLWSGIGRISSESSRVERVVEAQDEHRLQPLRREAARVERLP